MSLGNDPPTYLSNAVGTDHTTSLYSPITIQGERVPMTGQTNGPDRLWSIVSAGSKGYTPLLLACALLAAACAKPAVHRDVSMDSLPLSMASQASDRHVLAGEW